MISLCILRSLCVYYDLYVYTTISMCILRSQCVYYVLNVYTTISMCILWSLCVYYNLYVCTTIPMCILQSQCVYYNLYVCTTIPMCILRSLCIYYNLYVYTTIPICILRSQWCERVFNRRHTWVLIMFSEMMPPISAMMDRMTVKRKSRTRQGDSEAPPTHPMRPEKNRVKPSAMTT